MSAVLTDALKAEIQEAYRTWLQSRGFRARRGQREMVAHVARTLAGDAPRILAVEAGTGTGKTAGYCLPAIPIARALGKSVIISSATVALQEQVVLRDLPDLQRNAGIRFSFALAKGRGRYVCLKRLDDRLRYDDQQEIPLFDALSEDGAALYQAMLKAFADRSWDGELDSWSEGVDEQLWRQVTTDHRGCTNSKCGFFKQCPFFKARSALEGVDVIVANHDLVLADLSLGGGAVLPEPEDSIYVLDEAHHLPDKTQQHFAARARLLGSCAWMDNVTGVLGSMTQRFARPDELVHLATRIADKGAQAREFLRLLHGAVDALPFEPRDETLETFRFPLGEVPENLQVLAESAAGPVAEVYEALIGAHELLQDVLAGEIHWQNSFEAEDWLPVLGQQQTRAAGLLAMLRQFGGAEQNAGIHARWANRSEQDVELVSAPIEPGHLLRAHLWDRCYAAVCTSATLTALGRFERFFERTGLQGVPGLRIPSPFDYPNIATLLVPEMRSDPRDFQSHSEEVARLLPQLLAPSRSALVLFTSWRQLNEVLRQLPDDFADQLRVQGQGAKQALLDAHRAAIDAGETSYLVGLASFAEGVDLPDDYCRHVVIVKLPFAVPDDPVDQAMAEWAESQGRNPFYEISVPDAALRLVQACGRLIRHEGDHGRITLLDKRVLTQRYGRTLLDALPPFRRQLGVPLASLASVLAAPDPSPAGVSLRS